MRVLTARRLLTHQGSLEFPCVTISADGLIEDISSDTSITSGDVLTPTFLDLHTHGAAGHDVMQATPAGFRAMQRFHASRGVSHYLPTTVTAPIEQTLAALERLAAAIERPTPGGEATPVGIHLEGPFISHAKRGVHPPADIQPPSMALFDRFQQAARGHIRLMTIAPETRAANGNETALDLIRHCTGQGVRVSLGHTNATATEARAGVEAGATSATHTFNAMRPLDHRDPGVLGTVLDDDRLYAELICDGIHVAPELVRLWLRMKGAARGLLVTDSISATGMPDGTYTLGTFEVEVAKGRALDRAALLRGTETLAGSVLTMDRAVANLMRFTEAPLATAVRLASTNPAALLGLDTAAAFSPGQPANFNVYSSAGQLQGTYLQGCRVDLS